MDPALRVQPGQQALTPAQEAEAHRFAAERIQAQLPPTRWMSRRPKPSCGRRMKWHGLPPLATSTGWMDPSS